jgi:hypothetical protein
MLGLLDSDKYGINITTPHRVWQLWSETESQCRAWKKNLDAVAKKAGAVAIS